MFKKAEEMTLELKERMRDGKGTVEILHILKKEELTGHARLVAKITLNPGCSIGEHEHAGEEEIFYILKGRGLVVDDGKTYEANAGDAILTGNGGTHSIENTGNEPLELMAVILLFV